MNDDIRTAVRDRYGAIASGVTSAGCCGGSCADAITSNLYDTSDTATLPAEAVTASLGCGNPTARIDLQPGQTGRLGIRRRH